MTRFHCFICIGIDALVHIIYEFASPCLLILNNLLLETVFIGNIILIYLLYTSYCITASLSLLTYVRVNRSLNIFWIYHVFYTSIKLCLFVPYLSISHIFASSLIFNVVS